MLSVEWKVIKIQYVKLYLILKFNMKFYTYIDIYINDNILSILMANVIILLGTR